MTNYHLRYNIYQSPGSPIERERWLQFDNPLNNQQVKEFLELEHGNKVSMILCKVICQEEFELIHPQFFAPPNG